MFFIFDAANNRFDISTDENQWLSSAVISSLFSYKKTDTQEYGWWATELTESFGSMLNILKRQKITKEALEQADDLSKQSLNWLLDSVLVSDIQIESKPKNNQLCIEITIAGIRQPKVEKYEFQLPYYQPII